MLGWAGLPVRLSRMVQMKEVLLNPEGLGCQWWHRSWSVAGDLG